MDQFSIFDELFETYKIEKPIRLIELFAGYGSQALALKYLGAKFEHYKICEWAFNSIIAYADAHKTELLTYGIDYTKEMSKEEIAKELFNKGVSLDYNKPATFEQLKRQNEDRLRLCYNSIIWTHNLVDVSKTKGIDLDIEYPKTFTYLLTYSFPCQDLSLAGKRAGMQKGTGTRSGLLFEVERMLKELYEMNQPLPQVLLMENVPQVHGEGNLQDFILWQNFLEKLGYSNYWQDLTATDFEIPQTRNRTFMISILGNYNYKFPKSKPLKLRLKDLLEKDVPEKYYLSEKKLNQMMQWNSFENPLEHVMGNNSTAFTITTRVAISEVGGINASTKLLSTQLNDTTNLRIKNATQKGYLEAQEGDGVDISNRMKYHRGTVQKDKSQTILTGGQNGVVVNTPGKVIELGNYSPSNHNASRIISPDGLSPTVMENHGTVTATSVGLRIRKLTPKECFRLMGVKDIDFENIARHQSNASLYHLAGDSIVVNVLMAIFKQLF